MGNDEVLQLLDDTATTADILASCFDVSQAFSPGSPVPDGGIPRSPAFDPTGPLTPRRRAEQEAAMRDLYDGAEPPPTFDDVLARVRGHARLLDIGHGQRG
ncbi:hypothetical protein [Pseudonocardia xishanensis]|uniref:Uncharacterized protein n=1 Tax=Pseudonocardia xishanensis TaxID=630995 RepID=A0ABP8RHM6_9PSEU